MSSKDFSAWQVLSKDLPLLMAVTPSNRPAMRLKAVHLTNFLTRQTMTSPVHLLNLLRKSLKDLSLLVSYK